MKTHQNFSQNRQNKAIANIPAKDNSDLSQSNIEEEAVFQWKFNPIQRKSSAEGTTYSNIKQYDRICYCK